MNTRAVVRIAVGRRAAQVARALGCNKSWVYRQCERPRDVGRRNFYQVFLDWLAALFAENRRGAEFLLADLETRIAEMREPHTPPGGADSSGEWRRVLAECELRRADVVRAALAGAGEPAVLRAVEEERAETFVLYQKLRARVSGSRRAKAA